jgi:DNA-binding NarL/FixJ family response regulator
MAHRILVVDQHQLMRARIRSVLEGAGWQVVGEAADGMDAVNKAREFAPDLVVIDLSLPIKGGLETVVEMLRQSPLMDIVVFSLHEEDEIIKEAFRAGVRAFVLKSTSDAELVSAIRKVLAEDGAPA